MRLFSSAVAGLVAFSLASVSSATVLTFDTGQGAPNPVPTNYGNRVGDPATFQPSTFHYGAGGGITPNVNVVYSPLLRLGGTASPFDPSRVFGDLANVIYRDREAFSGGEPGILQISFFADPGVEVRLHSFDIAALYNSITGQGEDLFAKSIKVLGSGGTVFLSLDFSPTDLSPSSPTSTFVPGTAPLTHRHFDFEAAPFQSQSITIRIDLNNYTTIGGSKVDRFALDNIKISQTPTPGASVLIALAACIAGVRRRRTPRTAR